jgi:hypothetical protein
MPRLAPALIVIAGLLLAAVFAYQAREWFGMVSGIFTRG